MALACRVIRISNRDSPEINDAAHPSCGIVRRGVGAGPVADHSALAVRVVGVREARSTLVLRTRELARGVITVAGQQAPAVDAQDTPARGVVLERDVVSERICRTDLPASGIIRKAVSISVRVNYGQQLAYRVIDLRGRETIRIDPRHRPTVGVINCGVYILECIGHRDLLARGVVAEAGPKPKRVYCCGQSACHIVNVRADKAQRINTGNRATRIIKHSSVYISEHIHPWAGSPRGLLPGAPTDPDVHVKCIRFVTLWSIAVPHTIQVVSR